MLVPRYYKNNTTYLTEVRMTIRYDKKLQEYGISERKESGFEQKPPRFFRAVDFPEELPLGSDRAGANSLRRLQYIHDLEGGFNEWVNSTKWRSALGVDRFPTR
jgi:hypothetical protein